MIEYLEALVGAAPIARFGGLLTLNGEFRMPAFSPGIRTQYDCQAVGLNTQAGLGLEVITPFASFHRTLRDFAREFLFGETRVTMPVLVLPDPEYEALSFNCTARANFLRADSHWTSAEMLMKSSLSGHGATTEVYRNWAEVTKEYGLDGVAAWAQAALQRVGSDIFLSPAPLIRATTPEVSQCVQWSLEILDSVMEQHEFFAYGVHLLIHAELFRNERKGAVETRRAILKEVLEWADPRSAYSRLFLSLKVHDPSALLHNKERGSPRRRTFSEFVGEMAEAIRMSEGALVIHNLGNLALGGADSGADIATFRVTGPPKVDLPVRGRRKLRDASRTPRDVPLAFNPTTLTDHNLSKIIAAYRSQEAFEVPHHVTPEPYWEWSDLGGQTVYTAQTRDAGLRELAIEYTEAARDSLVPLKESLQNRVRQSNIQEQLSDLCPTLG